MGEVQVQPRMVCKFISRYAITSRAPSNKKAYSVEARIPSVRKFHQGIRDFCRTGPNRIRDRKYGRFPAAARFQVEQVPLTLTSSKNQHTKNKAPQWLLSPRLKLRSTKDRRRCNCVSVRARNQLCLRLSSL